MYEENIEPEFMKRPKGKPFRTPDNYFDSIEDRVMGTIKQEAKKKTASGSGKIILLLKPVLGIAAGLALIYILASYPTKYSSSESIVKSEATDTTSSDVMDAYSLNLSMIDDNSLAEAIIDAEIEPPTEMNKNEVLAYLSTEMTDLEIYSEMQN